MSAIMCVAGHQIDELLHSSCRRQTDHMATRLCAFVLPQLQVFEGSPVLMHETLDSWCCHVAVMGLLCSCYCVLEDFNKPGGCCRVAEVHYCMTLLIDWFMHGLAVGVLEWGPGTPLAMKSTQVHSTDH